MRDLRHAHEFAFGDECGQRLGNDHGVISRLRSRDP
jgi:hypothetical protein